MSMNVKPDQLWTSVRNGKTVKVLKVLQYLSGAWAAWVETKPSYTMWLTIGKKGIIGYRLK